MGNNREVLKYAKALYDLAEKSDSIEKTLNNLEKANQFELIQELYDNEKLGEIAYKNMQNGLNIIN